MDTKERILKAGLAYIDEGRFDFSMREIGTELGISSGSLFHAYASRNALLGACFATGIAAYQAAVTPLLDTGDPVGAIDAWIGAHAGWVEANPELARFLFSSSPSDLDPAARDELAKSNEDFLAAQAKLWAALRSLGHLDGVSDRLAHSLIIGPAHEHCQKWLEGRGPRPTEELRALRAGATRTLGLVSQPREASGAQHGDAAKPETQAEQLTFRGVVEPAARPGRVLPASWTSSVVEQATERLLLGSGFEVDLRGGHDVVLALTTERTELACQLVETASVDVHSHLISTGPAKITIHHRIVDAQGRELGTAEICLCQLDATTGKPIATDEADARPAAHKGEEGV